MTAAAVAAFVMATAVAKIVAHSFIAADDTQWVFATALGLAVAAVVTTAGAAWAQPDQPPSDRSASITQTVSNSQIISRGDGGPAIGNSYIDNNRPPSRDRD